MAAGLSNPQIGRRLFLSARTVANNGTNILAKLHLTHHAEAIVRARDAGLGRTDPARDLRTRPRRRG